MSEQEKKAGPSREEIILQDASFKEFVEKFSLLLATNLSDEEFEILDGALDRIIEDKKK